MPNYEISGTGKPYSGRVIKMGDQFYTTTGGGIEGDRQLLKVVDNVSTTSMEESTTITDTVTTFVVGDTSNFGRNTYYYGNGSVVPNGTALHHHTISPAGRNNFMTQHNMDGNEQDVFLTQPTSTRRANTRTMRRTNTRRRTTGGGTTGGSSNNNPGGNVGGGNTNQGGGMVGGGGGSY